MKLYLLKEDMLDGEHRLRYISESLDKCIAQRLKVIAEECSWPYENADDFVIEEVETDTDLR